MSMTSVAGEPWDVVIDVSRQPGQVRSAVAALAATSRFYVVVSSGNVYADHSRPGQDETTPVLPALEEDVMESVATYGEAKVACEQFALGGLGPDQASSPGRADRRPRGHLRPHRLLAAAFSLARHSRRHRPRAGRAPRGDAGHRRPRPCQLARQG